MLDTERLEELIDKVTEKILIANRTGELDSLLDKWGFSDLIESETYSNSFYDTRKDGKIVVLGASQVKERDLLGIVKGLGLDKDRFELCLDYKEIEGYQFSKLQYNTNYRLVIVGPMPHSTTGKGERRSTIAEMENGVGYPKVIRLGSNELKITKSNFRQVLQEQITANYI
ncbi:MAG: hypothetical protein IJ740_06125 [Ruminococcus sp.]|nr:hypothetical protein [Ruminococcus sp.]